MVATRRWGLTQAREREVSSLDALLATDPFEATFESARVGLAIVDLQGRFVRVNGAYAALTGIPAEDLVGAPFTVEPEQLAAMVAADGVALSRQFERELRPGVWVLQGVTLRHSAAGSASWFVVDAQDISDRRRMEADLAHRVLHDQLTGLPNRVLALDRLRLALARARRTGASVGVVFGDLDGFKAVNDHHGHLLGDVVLQEVAARLTRVVRPSDTVARLGGDEFLIVVEAPMTAEELDALVVRLSDAVSAPLRERGTDTRVGLSAGAVLSDPRERDPEALVARADQLMYAAKRARRAAQDGAPSAA